MLFLYSFLRSFFELYLYSECKDNNKKGDGRIEMGDGKIGMGDGRIEMGDGKIEMGEVGCAITLHSTSPFSILPSPFFTALLLS